MRVFPLNWAVYLRIEVHALYEQHSAAIVARNASYPFRTHPPEKVLGFCGSLPVRTVHTSDLLPLISLVPTITTMSGEGLSIDQLLALLNDRLRCLSAFGIKHKSTVSNSPFATLVLIQ